AFKEKDSDDGLEESQVILYKEDKGYRTSNVMGYLGYDGPDKTDDPNAPDDQKQIVHERLVIRSRFSSTNTDDENGVENDYFLQYLLEQVLELPSIIDFKTDSNRDNRLFNWLLFLFPYYLKTAMRKGVFKTYIRRQYNDANVKGTIDVARHIKMNTPFVGKIAYNQREHSSDNYLLRLIRLTIDYIKSKGYGNILSNVKDEIQLVIGATPGYAIKDRNKIIEENKKRPIRHAYYHEYRTLQQLCLWILLNEKHQLGQGKQKIYGILFDGAWLWEEYVNKLIGDLFHHPRNKARKGDSGAQQLFSKEIIDKNNRQQGRIYPDFIGKPKCAVPVIADAKYKPEYNIHSGDYLQILAYMFRFSAKLGLFLYPKSSDDIEETTLRMNKGNTFDGNVTEGNDILVIKRGLVIPSITGERDYNSFRDSLDKAEKEFIDRIRKLIEGQPKIQPSAN
ncbi:hypothetical protein IJT17_07990, partial [bacterium]|nr:hypothetical protein [bacterium]